MELRLASQKLYLKKKIITSQIVQAKCNIVLDMPILGIQQIHFFKWNQFNNIKI